MGDPRGVTAATPGSDQSKNIPPNREAIAFTERALFQVMGMPPKLAGQMANACNGLYNNLRSGKYDQYLPKVTYTNAAQTGKMRDQSFSRPTGANSESEEISTKSDGPKQLNEALKFPSKNTVHPSGQPLEAASGAAIVLLGKAKTNRDDTTPPKAKLETVPTAQDFGAPSRDSSTSLVDANIRAGATPPNTTLETVPTAQDFGAPSRETAATLANADTNTAAPPSNFTPKAFPTAQDFGAPSRETAATLANADTNTAAPPSNFTPKAFPTAQDFGAPSRETAATLANADTNTAAPPSNFTPKAFPTAQDFGAPSRETAATLANADTNTAAPPSNFTPKAFPTAQDFGAPSRETAATLANADTNTAAPPSASKAAGLPPTQAFVPPSRETAATLASKNVESSSEPFKPSSTSSYQLASNSVTAQITTPRYESQVQNRSNSNASISQNQPVETAAVLSNSTKPTDNTIIASSTGSDAGATNNQTAQDKSQTAAQTNAVASTNTDKIAPVVDASKTTTSQTQGEALARNQATTPGTTTPTATDATLAAANTTNASKLSTALSGLGIAGTQGIIGTETASTSLERQSGAAHANLPDQAALLNGAQLAQANLANTVNNPNAGNLNIQSSLAALLNPAQGGINALGRDNSVALNEQQALVGPLGTPLHPAFTSLADAEKGQILPGAIGNPLNIKEVGPTYNSSTAALSRSNIDPSALTSKDAPSTPIANAANTQATIQSFQGMLQPGQGAVKGAEDTSKTIVKGAGGPGLPDALTAIQGTGKKGVASVVEGSTGPLISMPGTLIGKGGKAIDGGDDTKLPIGQTINPTQAGAQTGLIVTAVAGAQVPGQTATTGQQTTGTGAAGTTGTTGTGTNTATEAKDPNATDIKSLVGALPAVEIYDPKENTEDEKEAQSRPEINYDSIDDDDDDDEFNDIPIIEGKRASSAAGAQIKAPKSKIGLSIIENVMVLLNDLKNKKLDDKTAQQMQLELFTDIFGKQKRRQSYMVRAEDTLETIAKYMLKDARLAPLLYTINVHAKNIPAINEEENKQAIYAITPGEQRILLPHRSEILRYKIHVLKDKEALVLYTRSSSLPESAEFTTYTCREEDTLSSIAASHIDVRDESKWAEIALLNNLSVRVNKKGKPIAKLKAGQLLRIPKAALTEEEEDEIISAALANNANKASNVDEGVGSAQAGISKNDDRVIAGIKKDADENDIPALAGAKVGPKITVNLNFNPEDEVSVSKALASMEKRIISQSNLGSGTYSVLMRLELKQGNNRLNVAEWDVNPRSSTLRLYDAAGGYQVIPVALPTRAARELAENDLKANANRYCEMFLSGKLAA